MNDNIEIKNKKNIVKVLAISTCFLSILVVSVFVIMIYNQRTPNLENSKNRIANEQKIRDEIRVEDEKPRECRKLLESTSVDRKIADFEGLKQGMNYLEYGDFYKKNLKNSGGFTYEKNGAHIDEIRVDDSLFLDIIKVSSEWSFSAESVDYDENKLRDNKLKKVQIVTNTCNIIEVPVNSDGLFNFQTALENI